jgi:hypothetical protein
MLNSSEMTKATSCSSLKEQLVLTTIDPNNVKRGRLKREVDQRQPLAICTNKEINQLL